MFLTVVSRIAEYIEQMLLTKDFYGSYSITKAKEIKNILSQGY